MKQLSTWRLGALSIFLAACAGGSAARGEPMVADPPGEPNIPPEGHDAGGDVKPAGDAATEAVTPPSPASPAAPSILQGNEEGAQALLKQFVAPDADHAALTRSLRPTSADYKALFDGPTAAKVEAAQAKDWNSGKAIIKPKPNQTEVKIWSATGADIVTGKGNAKEFPGGYKKLGKHLSSGVTFFRFKFVESGKEVGTAYDGLAFVNGHWVIAPKPWRAFESKPDKDEDEGADDPPKKPAKKRPKKK